MVSHESSINMYMFVVFNKCIKSLVNHTKSTLDMDMSENFVKPVAGFLQTDTFLCLIHCTVMYRYVIATGKDNIVATETTLASGHTVVRYSCQVVTCQQVHYSRKDYMQWLPHDMYECMYMYLPKVT